MWSCLLAKRLALRCRRATLPINHPPERQRRRNNGSRFGDGCHDEGGPDSRAGDATAPDGTFHIRIGCSVTSGSGSVVANPFGNDPSGFGPRSHMVSEETPYVRSQSPSPLGYSSGTCGQIEECSPPRCLLAPRALLVLRWLFPRMRLLGISARGASF